MGSVFQDQQFQEFFLPTCLFHPTRLLESLKYADIVYIERPQMKWLLFQPKCAVLKSIGKQNPTFSLFLDIYPLLSFC